MKSFFQFLLSVLVLSLASVNDTSAQMIIVQGTVLDKELFKPIPNRVVTVFRFNTVAEAKDAYDYVLKNKTGINKYGEDLAICDPETGDFEITVAADGALMIVVEESGAEPELLPVNGQQDLGDILITAARTLENVDVVKKMDGPEVRIKTGRLRGDTLDFTVDFAYPSHTATNNSRLVIQPYVVDCTNDDTIIWCKGRVFDSAEYTKANIRRWSFHPERDPLYKNIVDSIVIDTAEHRFTWMESVKVPNTEHGYHCNGFIRMFDYTSYLLDLNLMFSPCELKHPFRFLEFNEEPRQLNFKDYYEKPRREKRNAKENVRLTFVRGKADLDPTNVENDVQLDKLKQVLLNVVNDPGTTLKELYIIGVASPEGKFETNERLSKERAAFALKTISNMLPKTVIDRTYKESNGVVAPWRDIIPLLQDTLPQLAYKVEMICDNNSSHDKQGEAIQALPEYSSIIEPFILPKLRKVTCEYVQELFSEMTREEIWDNYLHNPDYQNGKKQWMTYQYWHLFQLEKDPAKLEKLYKMAYEQTKASRNVPWVLAANLLASSYLKRDTFDISLLDPYINETRDADFVMTTDGRKEIINPSAVVYNQLAMYIRAGKTEKVSILNQLLPNTEENELIKAMANCICGYFENDPHTQEIISKSSDLNAIIMALAMESAEEDHHASQLIKFFPKLQSNPVALYQKAIIETRLHKEDGYLQDAKNALMKSWEFDQKYMEYAKTDGEFFISEKQNLCYDALKQWNAKYPNGYQWNNE